MHSPDFLLFDFVVVVVVVFSVVCRSLTFNIIITEQRDRDHVINENGLSY